MIPTKQPKHVIRKVNFSYSYIEEKKNAQNTLLVTYKYRDIDQELYEKLHICKSIFLILPIEIQNKDKDQVQMRFPKLEFSQINFQSRDVILSIAICLADLEKRGIPMTPYKHLFVNYKEMIYLNLMEFNYQLSNNSFNEFRQEFNIQMNYPDYDEFIKSHSRKNNTYPPYWDIMKKILHLGTAKMVTEGNSWIYETQNNPIMQYKSQRNLEKVLIIKSTKHMDGYQKSVLNARKEIEMMEKFDFQGSHLLTCLFYVAICDQIYIFMDKLVDLKQYLESEKFYKEQNQPRVIFEIVHQFAKGLQQLHEHQITHRDLKPENLFLNLTVGVKLLIGDFDCSKSNLINQEVGIFQTEYHSFTYEYNAPEQHNADVKHTDKADIWQFGFICLVIASREEQKLGEQNRSLHLYFGNSDHQKQYQDRFGKPIIQEYLKNYKDQFIELIQACLKYYPDERPDIEKVIEKITNLSSSLFKEQERVPQRARMQTMIRYRNLSIVENCKSPKNLSPARQTPSKQYREPQVTQIQPRQHDQSQYQQQSFRPTAQTKVQIPQSNPVAQQQSKGIVFLKDKQDSNPQNNQFVQNFQQVQNVNQVPNPSIIKIISPKMKTEESQSSSHNGTLEKQSQQMLNDHNLKKTNEQLESMDRTDTLPNQQSKAQIKIIKKP